MAQELDDIGFENVLTNCACNVQIAGCNTSDVLLTSQAPVLAGEELYSICVTLSKHTLTSTYQQQLLAITDETEQKGSSAQQVDDKGFCPCVTVCACNVPIAGCNSLSLQAHKRGRTFDGLTRDSRLCYPVLFWVWPLLSSAVINIIVLKQVHVFTRAHQHMQHVAWLVGRKQITWKESLVVWQGGETLEEIES